jgi:predicted GIY-YIG superfamily endonuclease
MSLTRDALAVRLDEMRRAGERPDYQRLTREVLGIRGAPPDLARRLVEQALVIEDRSDHWRRVGERVRGEAPAAPGVYIFRDVQGRALYVGKATNLRRRLGAHFSARRWRALVPAIARVEDVEWQITGSELEAVLREATLIDELQPAANVQIGAPAQHTRAVPAAIVRDLVVLVPSVDPDASEIVAAHAGGRAMILRTPRTGDRIGETAATLWAFFHAAADVEPRARLALAPLVFSWLAGRGRRATWLDPHDAASADELAGRLAALLNDGSLFVERLVILR